MRRYSTALSLALLVASVPAHAQVRSSANFAIVTDAVEAAGGASSSAGYVLRASAGLAFATPPMVGTNYNSQPGLQAAITAAGADTQPP